MIKMSKWSKKEKFVYAALLVSAVSGVLILLAVLDLISFSPLFLAPAAAGLLAMWICEIKSGFKDEDTAVNGRCEADRNKSENKSVLFAISRDDITYTLLDGAESASEKIRLLDDSNEYEEFEIFDCIDRIYAYALMPDNGCHYPSEPVLYVAFDADILFPEGNSCAVISGNTLMEEAGGYALADRQAALKYLKSEHDDEFDCQGGYWHIEEDEFSSEKMMAKIVNDDGDFFIWKAFAKEEILKIYERR